MNYSIKVNKLEKENWSTKAFVSVVFEESLKVTDITNRVILSTKIIFIRQRQNLERNFMTTS